MTIRAEPLISRLGILMVTVCLCGIMAYAVVQDNWIALVVCSLVLLFILGADTSAILRAWRGLPDPPEDHPREVTPK
jgi:hypothetical protein